MTHAEALAMEKARKQLAHRCEVLRERLKSADFLANKGLGNEVGFYLFCYDPALELEVREFVRGLVKESESGSLGCRIVKRDLYDVFLGICQDADILDRIIVQEHRRGLDSLNTLVKRAVDVEDFVTELSKDTLEPDSVVMIAGVGEIYPILRLHELFENLQQRDVYADAPVVAFYPGHYTGNSFSLFSKLSDGSFYRAFDLI